MKFSIKDFFSKCLLQLYVSSAVDPQPPISLSLLYQYLRKRCCEWVLLDFAIIPYGTTVLTRDILALATAIFVKYTIHCTKK